ncbi:CLUMA_CG010095, isoform A [Clunio marinus]|uniref:CLUMA_CG010095, isoform A n=1 Tax=Clunio marinus TaxID=568069 RepID=A0A1J1I957_9DIPT|nr:CLUMA_CG010095, isoform A [Clunio marinus]
MTLDPMECHCCSDYNFTEYLITFDFRSNLFRNNPTVTSATTSRVSDRFDKLQLTHISMHIMNRIVNDRSLKVKRNRNVLQLQTSRQTGKQTVKSSFISKYVNHLPENRQWLEDDKNAVGFVAK